MAPSKSKAGSLQSELANEIKKAYKDADVKKIDVDKFLDIHIPSIHEKRGTHLFFNTAKDEIKIGFYVKDESFVKKALAKSDNIEAYASGLRPLGNPSFNNVQAAIKAALDFLSEISGKGGKKAKPEKATKKSTTAKAKPEKAAKKNTGRFSSEEEEIDLEEHGIEDTDVKLDLSSMFSSLLGAKVHIVNNRPEIIAAVADRGDLKEVKKLIKEGVDLDVQDTSEDKYTAVHFAAWDGKDEILKALLAGGAWADLEGANGRTPLHIAAANGRLNCVKVLIKAGVEIDKRIKAGHMYHSEEGGTALRDAVLNQHWDVADLLIKNGASLEVLAEPCSGKPEGENNFFDAIRALATTNNNIAERFDEDRLSSLEELVDNSGSANELELSEFQKAVEAFKQGNHKAVADYIKKGNPPMQFNQDDSIVESELIYLVMQEEVSLVKIKNLIDKGIDVNERNVDGDRYTAVHFAAWDGKVGILKYLIKSGTDPDIVGNDGRTALHLAAANGHTEAVELLLNAGADINRRFPNDFNKYYSENGGTAIREAVFNQVWDVIELLIRHGADVSNLTEPCIESLEGKNDFFSVIRIFNKLKKYPNGTFNELKLSKLEKKIKGDLNDISLEREDGPVSTTPQLLEFMKKRGVVLKEVNSSDDLDEDDTKNKPKIEEKKPTAKAKVEKKPIVKKANIPIASQVEETEQNKEEEEDFSFIENKPYKNHIKRFWEIANKTGILINNIIVEPDTKERDELWGISRAFAERIYKVDNDKNPVQHEIDVLCFYAIVALHWCDIYVTDKRFSFENGRFRRDTNALVLCFYARIDREYRHYDFIKLNFIMPHTQFSVLLWTINSIVNNKQDAIFGLFSPDQAKKAQELFSEMEKINKAKGKYGFIDIKQSPEKHPLRAIWQEVYRQFASVHIPFQFIKSYISQVPPQRTFLQNILSPSKTNNAASNVTLLDVDRQKNTDYLQKQIQHKQFPIDWIFINDLAFVCIYFGTTTDGKLSNIEKDAIFKLMAEWFPEEDGKKVKEQVANAFNKAKAEFDKDNSKEKYVFALENIRRFFYVANEWDDAKTHIQLLNVFKDLISVAASDDDVIDNEADLLNAIMEEWGIKKSEVTGETEDAEQNEDDDDNNDETQEGEIDISDIELSDFDFKDEEQINRLCEKIKKEKLLPHQPYVNEALRSKGFDADNHQAHFFASSVLVHHQELEGFLFVNMDWVYSNCINDQIRPIFPWDEVKDIKYTSTEKGSSIDIIAADKSLTIKNKNNKSLKILYTIYQYVWKDINKKFIGQPMIVWNEVDKMGIKRESYESHEEYLDSI